MNKARQHKRGFTLIEMLLVIVIIAILVALLILKESFELFFKAYAPLLDLALPADEIAQISEIIRQNCSVPMSFHDLRTRKAGSLKYIDFHLNLDPDMTVRAAHEICDHIENEIKKAIDPVEVTIHVENF